MRPLPRAVQATHALLAGLAFPATRTAAVAAWGAVQAGVAFEILRPGSRLFAENIRGVEGESERVAITFDDGPRPGATEILLDRLDAAGVKASFFLVGDRARAHPEIVRRMAAAGHTIGNHTRTHPALWGMMTRRRALEEVGAAQAILGGITGAPPAYFRPPMGHKNLHLAEILDAHALKQVTWSIRPFDTVIRSPSRILRRVVAGTRAGGIVLLHDPLETKGGAALAAEVVSPLLAALSARRLRPVSLDDLLAAGRGGRPAPR